MIFSVVFCRFTSASKTVYIGSSATAYIQKYPHFIGKGTINNQYYTILRLLINNSSLIVFNMFWYSSFTICIQTKSMIGVKFVRNPCYACDCKPRASMLFAGCEKRRRRESGKRNGEYYE